MQHSERLIFDKPGPEDFDRYYEIHSDPQTNLFNPGGPMNIEKAEETFKRIMADWENHHFGSWTIKTKDVQKIIGFGGISYRMYGNESKLNLGYRFDKDHWGMGYATELALYSIKYAFSELKKTRYLLLLGPNTWLQ